MAGKFVSWQARKLLALNRLTGSHAYRLTCLNMEYKFDEADKSVDDDTENLKDDELEGTEDDESDEEDGDEEESSGDEE